MTTVRPARVLSRTRWLRPDDVRDGTFTVNNSGVLGAVTSRPSINQPQTAVVTTHRIVRRPIVVDDAIMPSDMMNMCLSFHQRELDLFQASAFVRSVKDGLEYWSYGAVTVRERSRD